MVGFLSQELESSCCLEAFCHFAGSFRHGLDALDVRIDWVRSGQVRWNQLRRAQVSQIPRPLLSWLI